MNNIFRIFLFSVKNKNFSDVSTDSVTLRNMLQCLKSCKMIK